MTAPRLSDMPEPFGIRMVLKEEQLFSANGYRLVRVTREHEPIRYRIDTCQIDVSRSWTEGVELSKANMGMCIGLLAEAWVKEELGQ